MKSRGLEREIQVESKMQADGGDEHKEGSAPWHLQNRFQYFLRYCLSQKLLEIFGKINPFTDPSEIAFPPTIMHRPQMENHWFGKKQLEHKEDCDALF